jgi:hypothetical protein
MPLPLVVDPHGDFYGSEGWGESHHWRKFTKLGHHDIVTFVWWCAAGALTVVSAALYGGQVAILSAANPAARLPWIGWPANTPRSAKVLFFFAMLASILAMECVVNTVAGHLYAFLWGLLPFGLAFLVAAVPQARHNRRVRSAA